jgi:hypothetical protein
MTEENIASEIKDRAKNFFMRARLNKWQTQQSESTFPNSHK